jgi:hypothetical protein
MRRALRLSGLLLATLATLLLAQCGVAPSQLRVDLHLSLR